MTKVELVSYIRKYLNDIDGVIWSDDYLIRIMGQAEAEISGDLIILWGRFALNTLVGIGLYPMPINILKFTRLTYRAFKMDMLTQKELALLSPVYRTQQSRPRWASLQFEGFYSLRLYPFPNEELTDTSASGGLIGGVLPGGFPPGGNNSALDANIQGLLIISAYFNAESSAPSFVLPNYFARRLVKLYTLYNAYAIEGPGQNINISNYFKKRYNTVFNETKSVMGRIYGTVEKQYADVAIQRPWKKFRPILPPNYGTPVDMF